MLKQHTHIPTYTHIILRDIEQAIRSFNSTFFSRYPHSFPFIQFIILEPPLTGIFSIIEGNKEGDEKLTYHYREIPQSEFLLGNPPILTINKKINMCTRIDKRPELTI